MNRIFTRIRAVAALALLVAGLAAVAVPGQLEAQDLAQRATVSVYSGGVDFLPIVSHRGGTVTISGNGITFEQVFAKGDRASIGMFDQNGKPLPDGTYTWSLGLHPDTATARELRVAATLNGGEAPEPWRAESGTFTIQGGVIVDQESVEARPTQPLSGLRSSFTASGLSSSRGPAEDDDAAVGSSADMEARVNAEAGRRAPSASTGALVMANNSGGNDADATSVALGQSLEPSAATSNNQLSAQSRGGTPRPRSDGSNGRPRSQ